MEVKLIKLIKREICIKILGNLREKLGGKFSLLHLAIP